MFARDWLASQGISAAAVFSGEGSDPYGDSLERLRTGELNALCVVDMFNEGLDIPAVDRVVMLRPTESKVIFLQQLGRGLRASEGKSRLLVIDFVGNHRIFAQRIIHLLSLQGSNNQWHTLKDWLNGKPADLPEGCLLDVEVDAKDMLKQFLPKGRNAGIEGYRAIRDDLGRRPTAMEVFSRGFLPRTICAAEGSWFGFAEAEGDLDDPQRQVVAEFSDWLKTVETTSLNKSYKMVVLRVLLDSGQLFAGIDLYELSKQCRRFMLDHEVLRRDLEGEKHAVDHENASEREWADWWIKWPIGRWLDAQNKKVWFVRDGDRFRLRIDCPDHLKPSLESMTEELVDWRLAAYAKSRRLVESKVGELAFEGKVSHTNGRPILFLPDKTKCPERPVGPIVATLPDGSLWEFKLVKVACNVAKPVGEKGNQLGDLLKQWFGPNAGLPGTNFHVRFESKSGEWHVSPVGAERSPMASQKNRSQIRSTEWRQALIWRPATQRMPRFTICLLQPVIGDRKESPPRLVGLPSRISRCHRACLPLGLQVDRWNRESRAIPGASFGPAQPDRGKDDCCSFKSIRRPIQKTAAGTPSSVIIPSSNQARMDGNISQFSLNRSTKTTSRSKYPARKRMTSELLASLSV